MDLTCYENDPNFPFWDPLHGMYHAFWQAHLAEPQGGVGQGPVIGHAVSADLVRWAHLPVALWNDQPFDRIAIFSGSATLVDGLPTLVYPGLCDAAQWAGGCDTGTVAAVAVPADHAGDPLLTNWSKRGVVLNNTQRDPTTAWRTVAGDEWRFTNFEGKVFSSRDNFQTWSVAGNGSAIFPSAECPDLFALPPRCAGNGCDAPWPAPVAAAPTHVHKISGNWPVATDRYTFGAYLDGEPGSAGTWTPTQGLPQLQAMDATTLLNISRKFYASKSFVDPLGNEGAGRRIFWGWLLVGNAVQSLPREVTYHPGLGRLLFTPLPELSALRQDVLFSAPSVAVPAGGAIYLSGGPAAAGGRWVGNQTELAVSFELPAAPAAFGVRFMMSAAGAGGMEVRVAFDPAAFSATVSVLNHDDPAPSYYMPGVDMLAPPPPYNSTAVGYGDAHVCQAACSGDAMCIAFTFEQYSPTSGRCNLRDQISDFTPCAQCVAGFKPPAPPPAATALPLVPGDTHVDVRVFIDQSVAEVFVAGGRWALTLDVTQGDLSAANMSLVCASGAGVVARNVSAWSLGSIWVPPSEVLDRRARRARQDSGSRSGLQGSESHSGL